MNLVKNELCKLFANRIIWMVLLLLIMNPLILIYVMNAKNDDGYSLKDYSSLYREISAYPREDMLTELKKGMDDAKTFGQLALCNRVYAEIEAALSYDEYLESIDEEAANAAIMSRFADSDGYALRNAEKIKLKYQKLKGTELSVENPMGILSITDSETTDYIAVLIVFILAVGILFFEKNGNQIFLLRTAPKGRKPLMASKCVAMIVSVIVITFLLYGTNFLVSQFFYGFGDFGRPVQSLYLYRSCPFDISVGGFLIRYFSVKILSLILLGLSELLICAVFDQIVFVFLASAVAVIVEIICYTKIPATHFLACLKYVNIMYGIKTGGMFSDYVNLNLFGYPVNSCLLFGVMWISLTCMFSAGVIAYLDSPREQKEASIHHSYRNGVIADLDSSYEQKEVSIPRSYRNGVIVCLDSSYEQKEASIHCSYGNGVIACLGSPHEQKEEKEQKGVSSWRLNFMEGLGGHTSLFLHECYKTFIPGRCLIVLVFFCFFVIWWNPSLKVRFDSIDEVYYKEYMDKLYGPLNVETYELLDQEKLKYESISDEIFAALEQGKSPEYIDFKYKAEINRTNAFDKVLSHVEYLESVDGGWVFYDKGYKILTDPDDYENRDVAQAFAYVIILVAMTTGICGVDYVNGEMRLLRTTCLGRRKLHDIKGLLGILCTVVSYVLVYVIRLLHVLGAYGTGGLHAPVASMEFLSGLPQNISLLQYLSVIMLMRLIGGLIITFVAFILFRSLKNSTYVIALCMIIFVVPLILVSLGVPNAQYLLCNPLLIGNVF